MEAFKSTQCLRQNKKIQRHRDKWSTVYCTVLCVCVCVHVYIYLSVETQVFADGHIKETFLPRGPTSVLVKAAEILLQMCVCGFVSEEMGRGEGEFTVIVCVCVCVCVCVSGSDCSPWSTMMKRSWVGSLYVRVLFSTVRFIADRSESGGQQS